MTSDTSIFIGRGHETGQHVLLSRANRHGLISGATGTGKTVTLQILAEGFARAGVPTFMADVKGDLVGLAMPGSTSFKHHDKLIERAETIGLDGYSYEPMPVTFWDLFGEQGHPIRATISEMGPLLLARLMGLNDTQEGVLTIAFRIADEKQMLLLDLKDLRAMLIWLSDNAADVRARYGNVAKQSIGAIQRRLLQLEDQGAEQFFAEPALDIMDFMRLADDGRGMVNILAADRLMMSPRLYATFLLWLLSELFEMLPEVGDPDKPKLVFFFDEAHLLFDDAPKALVDKIEQVVRLIRSKGVGVFFVTQNPGDVPDEVSAQLGTRIQHALRAFTPREQKAIRAVAETFRPNPGLKVTEAVTELQTGEALTSSLDEDGAPTPVERTLIRPPSTRLGTLSKAERTAVIASSHLGEKYREAVDRESAYEILAARAVDAAEAEAAEKEDAEARAARKPGQGVKQSGGILGGLGAVVGGTVFGKIAKKVAGNLFAKQARDFGARMAGTDTSRRQSATRSAVGTVGSELGAEIGRAMAGTTGARIGRGVLGSFTRTMAKNMNL
ncbi:MAG: helicase HerA-like domain-containing protein [Pacificimonas sp.]|nr:helicase HerA-like domain-containing protein [Pacificimonas sp.]